MTPISSSTPPQSLSGMAPEQVVGISGSSSSELAKQSQDSLQSSAGVLSGVTSMLSQSILPDAVSTALGDVMGALGSLQSMSSKFGGAAIPTDTAVTQDDIGDRRLIFETTIYEMSILTGDTPFNLLKSFVEVSITETLESGVSGSITFASDIGGILDSQLPFSGQKPLMLTWGMPLYNGTIIKRSISGFMYECHPSISSDPHRRLYIAKFTGTDTIKDMVSTVSKSYYGKTIQVIIEDLLLAIGSLPVVPNIKLLPEDANKKIEHFCVTGMISPTTAIRRLLSAHSKNAYDVFQRLTDKGQQFCIQSVTEKKNLNLTYTLGKAANYEAGSNDIRDKYITISHRFSDPVGFDKMVCDGLLASRTVVYSPTRKRIMVQDYDRLADATPVLNNKLDNGYMPMDVFLSKKHPLYPNPNNNTYIISDNCQLPTEFMSSAKTTFNERGKRVIGPRMMRNVVTGEVFVGGNVALSPACVININVPATSEGKTDSRLSGQWYITAVTHIHNVRSGYNCSVEIARETVSDTYGIATTMPEYQQKSASSLLRSN